MPITRATNPPADNPSVTTNTTMAPDPDMGGDLVAAIALLAQTLAAQNTRPPAAQSAPAVPVTSPTRLWEPDIFDGSDANKLQVFILQCSLHFQDRANAFSSGKAKVTYALSFLTGPALSWFEPMLFDLALPAWVNDWDLFHMELETNFGLFDVVGEAEAEIKTLVMAEGSCSAIYFVEFNAWHPTSSGTTTPSFGKPTTDWPVASKTRWCTMTGLSHCWISVSSYKPSITITGSRRLKSRARLTRRVRLTIKLT